MQYHKPLLAVMMISSMVDCSAMDKPLSIQLEKRLFTKIPTKLVKIYQKNDSSQKFFAGEIVINENKVSLINLIATQYGIAHDYKDSACRKDFSINNPMFCPTVVKIKKDNTLKNLGPFCCTTHQDVIEACRIKQATFLSYKQGAIVYYPLRVDFLLGENIDTKNIMMMIDKNLAQMRDEGIDLKIPVIFDTSIMH